MKLKDLLDRLNGLSDTEKDKDAVELVHAHAAAEVFQPIFDRGHSVGLTKGSTKTTEAETRATTAETKATEAERQLNEFKQKHPEAAKLQEQYQSDLQKKDQEHQTVVGQKDQEIDRIRRSWAKADLVTELVDRHKVDRDYAEVIANKAENEGRIRFNEKGEREVLQRGKDIAIVPTVEKGPIGMFADELIASVPKKFITSGATKGGGLQEESGGGGGDKAKTQFDKTREAEKQRQKDTTGEATSTAAKRLGSVQSR